MKTSHEFALRLGQIEGGTIHTRHRTGDIHPEDHEGERVVEEVPIRDPAGLLLGDRHQVHAARKHHWHDDAHPQRHLVTDHLGGLAHGTEQRPLRGRCVARQNHAKDFQAEHGDHEKYADVEPLAHEIERKRQGDERTKGRTETDVRGEPKEHAVGPFRHQVFLGEEFDAVGKRLEPAKTAASPRGAEAVLNSGGDLSLGPDKHEGATRDHVEDQGSGDKRRDGPAQPLGQTDRVDEKISHRNWVSRWSVGWAKMPSEPSNSRVEIDFVKNRTKFAPSRPNSQVPGEKQDESRRQGRASGRSRPSRCRGSPRWPERRRSDSHGRARA